MVVLVALAVISAFLFVLGMGLLARAWRLAGSCTTPADTSQATKAQLLGGLAAGVLTGAVATLAVLLLQQWLSASSADTVWRANVATAADIPGFTPGNHSLQDLNLSGKQLEDANLSGADLRGVPLEDTDLRGAHLGHANLQGDNLIGANLASAELPGANLSGAKLQAARFDNAYVEKARFAEFKNGKWIRAIANISTCWPQGFLHSRKAKQIRMGPSQYSGGLSRGREQPHCLPTHWPASVLH
jgi:uncharacterized protein YjbI with pentapeptide repeats